MKHFHIQILPQICCSNMLVLGLRPGTIPSLSFDFHLKVQQHLTSTLRRIIIGTFPREKLCPAFGAGLNSKLNIPFHAQVIYISSNSYG
jgi:hypothetical protein